MVGTFNFGSWNGHWQVRLSNVSAGQCVIHDRFDNDNHPNYISKHGTDKSYTDSLGCYTAATWQTLQKHPILSIMSIEEPTFWTWAWRLIAFTTWSTPLLAMDTSLLIDHTFPISMLIFLGHFRHVSFEVFLETATNVDAATQGDDQLTPNFGKQHQLLAVKNPFFLWLFKHYYLLRFHSQNDHIWIYSA